MSYVEIQIFYHWQKKAKQKFIQIFKVNDEKNYLHTDVGTYLLCLDFHYKILIFSI